MQSELSRKNPATVVRTADRTVILRRPAEFEILRGRTQEIVLKQLKKLERRGYIADASPLVRTHGGGWAVKVGLNKPLPEPMPSWAKGAIVVGSILFGLALVGIGFMLALAALLGAVAQVPWKGVAVAAGAIALLMFATPIGRRCCKVVVEVWH